MHSEFSSKLLNDLVDSVSKLPGIGKKSSLRIALYLINGKINLAKELAENLNNIENIKFCTICHNLSDSDICNICSDPTRKKNQICVVENVRDLIAIENTQQYNGVYHVLGALISPMEGITPEQLNIQTLIHKLENNAEDKELIMALSPNIEGETTIYYISNLINNQIKISLISRGVAFGTELDYTDELTLGRSIVKRIPYKNETEIYYQ